MNLFPVAVLAALFLMTALSKSANADGLPFVHPLFTDDMVLQRDMQDPVWGWTTPGERVSVSFEGTTSKTVAGSDGKWMVKIGPFKAGGPSDLTISGPQTVTLHNVAVGDVWICAGQSNMEFGVSKVTDQGDFVQHSANPNLRTFLVPHNVQTAPVKTVKGQWLVAGPDTLTQGGWDGFSSIGYFFGKEIQQKENIPIGLIESAWGGTTAEAWTSSGYLEKIPEFKPRVEKLLAGTEDLSKFNEYSPTALYNGMIAPLQPFGIKGVIWYQGSSNATRGMQYRTLMPAVIASWRDAWAQGDFPFYIGSLLSYGERSPDPRENSTWANLREAQLLTANTVTNCAETVNFDIGDSDNLHPQHKAVMAHRYALVALAKAYGENVECRGPEFTRMDAADSGKITLHFDHAEGLNAATVDTVANVPPTTATSLVGFQIAGDDKNWVWADAVIEGDTVVVSAATVPNPVAVRYAWQNNPAGNLFNSAGLPASPFRTDVPPTLPQ